MAAEIRADTRGSGWILTTEGPSVAKTLRLRVRAPGHRPALRSREIAIDELRDRDGHGRRVGAGERLTVTVDGEPVADVVPHAARRSPWVPAAELRRIQVETPADHRLLGDLATSAQGDRRQLTPQTAGSEPSPGSLVYSTTSGRRVVCSCARTTPGLSSALAWAAGP